MKHGPEPGPFDYVLRTRIVFGVDTVERVGEIALEMGVRKILLVTDAGLVAAGHGPRLAAILEASGLEVFIFDQVHENPTTADVDRCLELAKKSRVEAIVGLGGGSSMDTAKGCNFLLTNGGRIQDYWGVGKATKPMLPLIAIPTTAGTGSECQSAALIADADTHQKMACLDPKAAARVAILDPMLTVSQPPLVTAHTGIDAIAHAVEAAVATNRNPVSLMFSREAFKLTVRSLPRVLEHPTDVEARGRMLLGAAFAGLAIENSMLGAAHSAANPLTARFGVVHGEAVGMMLPAVVRFNSRDLAVKRAYAELASAPENDCVGDGVDAAVEGLLVQLNSLLRTAKIAPSLAAVGVDEKVLPTLAEEASKQWTARFNPRPVNAADFLEIYQSAFSARAPSIFGLE